MGNNLCSKNNIADVLDLKVREKYFVCFDLFCNYMFGFR